jgi:hypothetical protein
MEEWSDSRSASPLHGANAPVMVHPVPGSNTVLILTGDLPTHPDRSQRVVGTLDSMLERLVGRARNEPRLRELVNSGAFRTPDGRARRRLDQVMRGLPEVERQLRADVPDLAYTEWNGIAVSSMVTSLAVDPPHNERYGKKNRPVYLLPDDRRTCRVCGQLIPNRASSGLCREHHKVDRQIANLQSAAQMRSRHRMQRIENPALVDSSYEQLFGEYAISDYDRLRGMRKRT